VNARSCSVLGFVFALSCCPFAQAAPPPIAQAEIHYLLAAIDRSGCQFYRNGGWYDSKQAQAHLRRKYEALTAANRIQTAEDFIERAATRSSMSGEAYAIRCNADPLVPTDRWLRDQLARYRSAAP
jgi:hypothetical protein